MTALADDEDLDDFYRPEIPATPRPRPRSPKPSSRSSSTGDFADTPRRARSTSTRAAFNDPYDDPSYLPGAAMDEDDRTFLRARRRVPVRRSGLLASKWGRLGLTLAALTVLGIVITIVFVVRNFFLEDPRFRIETAQSIQLIGNSELTQTDLLSIFGTDVGHNIFQVPLAARRNALQQLPWVAHATVMRLLPGQLRVSIVERTPVAFVRSGSKIQLVDSTGVLLTMPPTMLARRHYSFPVVNGINATDPAETRAERMQLYQKFIADLDTTTPGSVSSQLSQVDVSNSEDIRALLPSAGSDILVHFGDEDFAARYKTYQQHLPQWRQQYPHLSAIDLRYDQATVIDTNKDTASPVATIPILAPATHKPSAKKPAAKKPAPHKHVPARPPVYSAKGRP